MSAVVVFDKRDGQRSALEDDLRPALAIALRMWLAPHRLHDVELSSQVVVVLSFDAEAVVAHAVEYVAGFSMARSW